MGIAEYQLLPESRNPLAYKEIEDYGWQSRRKGSIRVYGDMSGQRITPALPGIGEPSLQSPAIPQPGVGLIGMKQ